MAYDLNGIAKAVLHPVLQECGKDTNMGNADPAIFFDGGKKIRKWF